MRVFLVFMVLCCVSCIFDKESTKSLKPIETYKLSIKEPSGITFYNNHLFIVSDFNGVVYKVNLKGKSIDKIQVKAKDLEGVAVNNKGDLFVASESKRSLLQISNKGDILKKYALSGTQKYENSGIEGVCFSVNDDCFYAVNEKLPRQLLAISKEGNVLSEIKIDFLKDLSGICEDASGKSLWLLSDESQKIIEISKKGKLLNSYKIPVKKAEGITIVSNQLYIVSDSQNKLYVFKKPN